MARLKLKPLGNRVLVKKLKEEEKKGIVLPEEAEKDEEYVRAEVVEVGTLEKMQLKKGDRVLLSGFGLDKKGIDVGGEELFFVKGSDILATIE